MGFPSLNNTAPLSNRYIGMYHWSSYWRQWDIVINVTERQWIVQAVDLAGKATGHIREHCTPMDARHFADKPFTV